MTSISSYLLETLLTLLAVSLLAVLVLFGARRVGVGRPRGPIGLVGQLPLEGRRAVYLVRVGKRVLVVGASEAGLSKLGEMDEDAALLDEGAPASAFARLLEGSRASKGTVHS